jgi:glyoxylase-like metal-dependent hydrolase (beta-lactamase superfamily II)
MRLIPIMAVVMTVLPAVLAGAQAQPAPKKAPAPAPLTVQPITEHLYLVKGGSGANAAFTVTEKEVFVIDAKMSAGSAAEMLAEIKRATSLPVTTLVITHSDGDHINGLPGFPKGLRIFAHEKCRADIAAAAETQPELKDYIPNKAYDQPRLEIASGGTAVVLAYFGPAHTSGDTVVHFPSDKAVFVGDLLFVGRDPLVHRFKGGRVSGYIKTLGSLLALEPPVETFLSGHADPLGRTDVEALRASMVEKQAKVEAMIAEGKSLEDIKSAFGIEDRPAGPGGRRFLSLVETIYLELTGK